MLIHCHHILFLLQSILVVRIQGCFWGRKLTRDDCEYFPKLGEDCEDVYQGRLQATEMTADLYKSVSRDPTVNQANLLLLPLEISRIISILIHGTANHERKESSLKEVGCYISKVSSELLASVQVIAKDSSDESSEEEETNTTRKMMSLSRQAFIDENYSANESFSRKSLCWFDLPMEALDFEDKQDIVHKINHWASETAKRAKKEIDQREELDEGESPPLQPLAGHVDLIEKDKVIVVASAFLKIPWDSGIFHKSDTKMDQSFAVAPQSMHNSGQMISIRVPMMYAKGSFKVLDNELYDAVALPLDKHYFSNGDLIVILPKKGVHLDKVEEQIVSSGTTLFGIIEKFLSYKIPSKIVEVHMPRLNLQIMHEWSTPANKKLAEVVDDDGNALNGDFVGVYQDVFVEMIESEGNSYMHDDIETSNMDTQLVFRVNKPFLFMLRMDHELLGLGRIKDPHWCKFCPQNKKEYYSEASTKKPGNSGNDYYFYDYADSVNNTIEEDENIKVIDSRKKEDLPIEIIPDGVLTSTTVTPIPIISEDTLENNDTTSISDTSAEATTTQDKDSSNETYSKIIEPQDEIISMEQEMQKNESDSADSKSKEESEEEDKNEVKESEELLDENDDSMEDEEDSADSESKEESEEEDKNEVKESEELLDENDDSMEEDEENIVTSEAITNEPKLSTKIVKVNSPKKVFSLPTKKSSIQSLLSRFKNKK